MKPHEEFESDLLILRKLNLRDAPEIFSNYASNPEILDYVSWKPHKTVEDTGQFLVSANKAWEAGTDFSFSIRLRTRNTLVGSIGMVNQSNSVSVGYILAKKHWGKGYATEAVRTLLQWLKHQDEVFKIWALTDRENEASGRVLEKAGMRHEGVIKSWVQFTNQGNKAKDCVFYVLG